MIARQRPGLGLPSRGTCVVTTQTETCGNGIVQVGKAFRNEIAPRAGLTRQREFTQAEFLC